MIMQTNNNNTNATTEPAMIINHRMYVVIDSTVSGSLSVKHLVGPNGGHYILYTYSNGKLELCQMTNMRTIWTGKK